ncbi:type II secretion system protein [Planococcus salinarum]|uniref:type II secretion system protein n=1 Tax=Planococcus salinarum TaxID=622695 RepID=UPI0021B13D03|nr:type II secretion system protein [Planococcus salinarum]
MRTGSLNDRGFSLLEVVIVLAILMAGMGIGLPAYNQISAEKEERRFFQLLRNDIYFAQSEAYRSGSSVSLVFRPDLGRYDIVKDIYNPLSSRKMPVTVTLKPTSNLTEIVYWSTGSVMDSGTLRFGTSKGEITIVVHLGKGRVVFSG